MASSRNEACDWTRREIVVATGAAAGKSDPDGGCLGKTMIAMARIKTRKEWQHPGLQEGSGRVSWKTSGHVEIGRDAWRLPGV